MKNRSSISAGPSQPFAAELRKIWDVEAGPSYDVRREQRVRHLVAIRTLSGAGEIYLENSQPITLGANSFILVELAHVRRYRCLGQNWAFWWFELMANGALPGPLNIAFDVRGHSSDTDAFEDSFAKLQNPSHAERCVASATFVALLHRWLAEIRLRRIPSSHRQLIEELIGRIHRDVSADWTLAQLTRKSGLSETTLRKEFKKATGCAPARFVREARLQAASQMLQQGIYTLAAIAEQLNFSSAFHLSAAFKKHFGVNPSEMWP